MSSHPARSRPIKAFVMAGGKGLRFRPYSRKIPKVLVEIDGESLLRRNIRQIKEAFPAAVITVVVGHMADQVEEEIKRLNDLGDSINTVTVEPDDVDRGLLTGYAAILPHVDDGELFVCVLGDEFYGGEDHNRFFAWIEDHPDVDVCCAIKKMHSPHEYLRNYAVMWRPSDARIERVLEKPHAVISEHFGLGLIASRKQLPKLAEATVREGRQITLIDLINDIISDGGRVYGVEFHDLYVNVNTRTDYYAALNSYRRKRWDEFTIDVIIPAWNETESIGYVVRDFLAVCTNVIVVDNVSKDGTAEVARAAGARVISEPTRGYGDALRKGMDTSSADILILIEADGTFRAEDVEKLLVFLTNSDAVIGTRTFWQYIEQEANMPFVQRIANMAFGLIITLLWWNRRTRFTDVGCTFRGLWRSSYLRVRSRLSENGPAFSPELMIELLNDWQRVLEVPVPYHPRMVGQSKFSHSFWRLARTALEMLRLIISVRLRSWFENARAALTKGKSRAIP